MKKFKLRKLFASVLVSIMFTLLIFSSTLVEMREDTPLQQPGTSVVQEFTREDLSKALIDRLKEFKLLTPEQPIDYISPIPGYPTACFNVIEQKYLNESTNPIPVYVFKSITVYGKSIAGYDQLSSDKLSLAEVLGLATVNKYREALEAFYHYVPILAYGIPSGYYDPQRLVGIKELYIPKQFEIKYKLKPKLLLVMVGFSDGDWVKDPVYIYYFGFETTGTTYDGVYTRVTIVMAIVIDEYHVLYKNMIYNAGIVFYYTIGTSAPLISSLPVTMIYGFIGVLFALVITFIEFDEEYKYYVAIFVIFIVQIFSFIALNAIAGISLNQLYGVVLSIGPWFIVLILLWIAPYLFASYKYYISIEGKEVVPSHFSAVFEGLLLAVATVIIALSIVFIRSVTEYIVAVSGPSGIYILVVIFSLLDMYVGITIGKLWATFGRYSEAFTSPPMR